MLRNGNECGKNKTKVMNISGNLSQIQMTGQKRTTECGIL
jgi:hypothetical protein